MNTSYFNTTKVSGEVLEKYTETAEAEKTVVLRIFKETRMPMTTSEVYEYWENNKKTPFHVGCEDCQPYKLYNFRRAISTLVKIGCIVKTNVSKKGMFNRPNFLYFEPSSCDKTELQKIGCLELF